MCFQIIHKTSDLPRGFVSQVKHLIKLLLSDVFQVKSNI